jgi:uncharacterized lipoprotein YddW (UPF0748 family)
MHKICLKIILSTLLALTSVYPAFAGYDGKHEWRAVWIATVNNIDWPSKPGLSSAQQQKELIEYLDLFKKLNINAVILQIRPTADAFYKSELEPWSIYLTGDQSKAPDPFYDPLEFAIKEAHKRGMELHAWLNPYRVSQDTANLKDMAAGHIARKHPEMFVKHTKRYYFDPAFPETREFLCKVIKDIITRYDVDGIHFDDYFYPNSDFNDDYSFSVHNRGYKPEDKAAWRRENVDMIVKMLHDTIKSLKPWIKFGISPYAVWRNNDLDPRGSATKSFSYTNYDHLYADILKWMERGWVDYILPQFYFNIGYPAADFDILTKWWADYSYGVPLYAGLGTYRLDAKAKIEAWRNTDEIAKQIDRIRARANYFGVCYFNARDFKENRLGINNLIMSKYRHPAISPVLKGFPSVAPEPPVKAQFQRAGNILNFRWAVNDKSDKPKAYYFVIYRFVKGTKPDFDKGDAILEITGEENFTLEARSGYDYYISALDRLQNESNAVKFVQISKKR